MSNIELEGYGLVEVVDWNRLPFPWSSDLWPIAAAVLWVAWRTPASVDREWAKIVEDRTFSLDSAKQDGQHLTMRDAIVELWSALHAQKIQAHAALGGAEQNLFIPPRHWTENLYFSAQAYTILEYNIDENPTHYVSVSVARARVDELWPEIQTLGANKVLKETNRPLPRTKRGRPQTERGKNAGIALQTLTDHELTSWSGEALASQLQISRTTAEEYRKQEIGRRAKLGSVDEGESQKL